MDINNLQRTLPQSYHVDAGRIRERLQQADKGIAAGKRQGDSVDISGEGRRVLREKMSAAKRMEPSGDIGKLSPINSGAYGMMNDFEKVMSELGGGSVSDGLVTKDYSQAGVDALKARFEKEEGTKTDSFDRYANKMAAAYQLMKGRIEEKYAAFLDSNNADAVAYAQNRISQYTTWAELYGVYDNLGCVNEGNVDEES